MKLDSKYLKFPISLPNDLEAFLLYYPHKFPGIVPYYEEIAEKIAGDPQAFREYGNFSRDELFAGFEKIKSDYERGDQEDLEFLVSIDQRFNKLICYRFWIVNYLFPDGPVHDFFIDTLKDSIRKFVSIGEDTEDFEGKILIIQRDLLQGDYADLYLSQALDGVELVKKLEDNPNTKVLIADASSLIEEDAVGNAEAINEVWDTFVELINDGSRKELDDLRRLLAIPLEQVEMRNSRLPLYNMLTHAIEFRDENIGLLNRHSLMKFKIDQLFGRAKEMLSAEEYSLFEIAYRQSRNFTIYKDVMGGIDGPLLPLWFGIHDKMKEILKKTTKIVPRPTGQAGVFYHLIWYMPDNLKAKVMTPDFTPFDLKTL